MFAFSLSLSLSLLARLHTRAHPAGEDEKARAVHFASRWYSPYIAPLSLSSIYAYTLDDEERFQGAISTHLSLILSLVRSLAPFTTTTAPLLSSIVIYTVVVHPAG